MSIIHKFDDYQFLALASAEYPDQGSNMIYPALGLAGEAGEAVDKIKKLWRNDGITEGAKLSTEQRTELAKELGDVLWYVAALASEIGLPMYLIATQNIQKLHDRKARGVIKGEGDNR